MIAALVQPPQSGPTGDHLLFFLARDEFLRLADPIDRYLALLAWAARNYAADFGDFISHQDSGRHYLAWNPEEINEARARNHARQIDGTQYWAVMTIDDAMRRRFVRGCSNSSAATTRPWRWPAKPSALAGEAGQRSA